MFGKKSSEKSAKNVFLYLHIISCPKNVGEETRETIFPETHYQCEIKMLGKKSSEKSAKNFFYIHTNIVTKYGGGENARNNFSETQE